MMCCLYCWTIHDVLSALPYLSFLLLVQLSQWRISKLWTVYISTSSFLFSRVYLSCICRFVTFSQIFGRNGEHFFTSFTGYKVFSLKHICFCYNGEIRNDHYLVLFIAILLRTFVFIESVLYMNFSHYYGVLTPLNQWWKNL